MEYTRGAEWRKWDLHVHTPESVHQNYTGSDPWDRFLSELRSLPPEIAVIGINDYWFLDGYQKVRHEFERGSFPNLLEIFPVIEVRTENFGGTDGKLRRINLHFICDPLLKPEVIDRQLLSTLRPRYQLLSDDPYKSWAQVISRESLTALGAEIKAQVPKDQQHRYGSDLREGFNNACVPYDEARKAVYENSILRDHVLLAVGKTEWAALKWNDQSIATKKSLLNSAHMVFTAALDREDFEKSRKALVDAGVNPRLLDCSDAHTWMESQEKDRLGNVLTWINADPTFRGLQHAIQEYDYRVSTEVRPRVLVRRATQPSAIIDRVEIHPVSTAKLSEPLFSCSVDINPGYVVILGNKGQGKSALLDIIGATANSDRYDDYSFLTVDRFRRKNGEAGSYEARLVWADKSERTVVLDAPFDIELPIRVDYLPQSLIERVCLADPQSKKKEEFETEIERVVFGHVPLGERANSTSLRQMVEARSRGVNQRLQEARTQIGDAARRITHLEDRQVELGRLALDGRLKDLERERGQLTGQVDQQRQELEARERDDGTGTQAKLREAEQRLADLKTERRQKYESIKQLTEAAGRVNRADTDVQSAISKAEAAGKSLASLLGVSSPILKIELAQSALTDWRTQNTTDLLLLRESLENPEHGIIHRIAQAEEVVEELKATLAVELQGAEAILRQIQDLEAQLEHLDGDPANPATIQGVKALLRERDAIPTEQSQAENDLHQGFLSAHTAAMEILDIKRSAYASATDFVASSELTRRVDLEFDVELNARPFASTWRNLVNRRKLTDLSEVLDDSKGDVLLADVPLDSASDLFDALQHVRNRLARERGSEKGDPRQLSTVLKGGHSASQLLLAIFGLSWLESTYVIRSAGKELSELSPGQRGLVLLMFYLLVDKSDRPLLLDQPEENLDNQTVRELLIPALRDAIGRRQVIVVTHNPNLAVVGDADQLILAAFDGRRFGYDSGSLERQIIGSHSIDVLEGTRAAFANRELKYERVVGDAS
ncbi:TrlF family AAA-like ATPase [Phytohabitans kaempferiae]|uniref:TrlF family AAA-like ATPase n=1 Tax=Phytohabitans kaempferiae TaxID=1620943 RepID=A0ABV6M6R4_9ACTN